MKNWTTSRTWGVNALYLNPIFQAGTNHRYGTIDYYQVDPFLGDTQVLRQLVDELYHDEMHIIPDGIFNHCGDNLPPFLDVMQKGNSSKCANWFTALSYPL
ncbi:MAG: alpha-amylase family glycosyl hydrolase [Anaerolineaceae bacterium]